MKLAIPEYDWRLEKCFSFKNPTDANCDECPDPLQKCCVIATEQKRRAVATIEYQSNRFKKYEKRAHDAEAKFRAAKKQLDDPPMYFSAIDCDTREEIDVYPLHETRDFMDRIKAALHGKAEVPPASSLGLEMALSSKPKKDRARTKGEDMN